MKHNISMIPPPWLYGCIQKCHSSYPDSVEVKKRCWRAKDGEGRGEKKNLDGEEKNLHKTSRCLKLLIFVKASFSAFGKRERSSPALKCWKSSRNAGRLTKATSAPRYRVPKPTNAMEGIHPFTHNDLKWREGGRGLFEYQL
ncbi:hypothetical protein JTE90_022320 [Oedothorax gibbosus]|uniref:Uncharacterized protein n=1 Tax=Oedothorax gibbosus TaxID=931172 RepID=A0AAV6VX82_9ARAC|nr:hypothetical protein JTE90_022320 [Oedothorax gibbosus]